MTTALISRERATRNINQASFTNEENAMIDTLLGAVSSAAEKYCRRKFQAQEHDELYPGTEGECLFLKHYPILNVQRVTTSPTCVLTVKNSSSSVQRATVQITDTGITLWSIASGSVSVDTSVTFASNTTVTALKTAIDAISGWSASIQDGDYSLWPSSDFRPLQGALNAKDRDAPLYLYVDDVDDYQVDVERGYLVKDTVTFGTDLDREDARCWPGGIASWRVIYTAGYESVPEDVQEAIAQWVAALFWQSKDNPAAYPATPPDATAFLLEQYKAVRL